MGKFFLYFMVSFYAGAGILHFVYLGFYLKIMPVWLPAKSLLICLSGVSEIILASLLLSAATRKYAAWCIVAMLTVFMIVIHIPQSIDFYKSRNSLLWLTLFRLPIQFLLIRWAYIYTRPQFCTGI
jgi:uncharacterized membrane protein